MRDALLLVDLIQDFRHEDGGSLLESYRNRHGGMVAAIEAARGRGLPVVYANDNDGLWDGDAPGLVRRAVETGLAGELVAAVAPRPGDRFVVKPRYSAFDHTPLVLILRDLEVERLLLGGAATEMCVVQSAIDARELDFKISVLVEACASTDGRLERLALEYLEDVVGARLERGLGLPA